MYQTICPVLEPDPICMDRLFVDGQPQALRPMKFGKVRGRTPCGALRAPAGAQRPQPPGLGLKCASSLPSTPSQDSASGGASLR